MSECTRTAWFDLRQSPDTCMVSGSASKTFRLSHLFVSCPTSKDRLALIQPSALHTTVLLRESAIFNVESTKPNRESKYLSLESDHGKLR